MSKKLVIIINGKGGVGKDTLIEYVSGLYSTINISSITPIKDIARSIGWDGKKDSKSRKFLSDLKLLCTEYNDLPYNYIMDNIKQFSDPSQILHQILFVQIREPGEIEKIKKAVPEAVTMLITRNTDTTWGNMADDNVNNYTYDVVFDNNSHIEESLIKFAKCVAYLLDDVDYS